MKLCLELINDDQELILVEEEMQKQVREEAYHLV